MLRPYRTLLCFTAVFILLNIWSILQPSALNWGIHSIAFFSLTVQIAAAVAAALLLVPASQIRILSAIDSLTLFFGRRSLLFGIVTVCALLIGACFLFPAKLHLLGDGSLLIRSIPLFHSPKGIPGGFRNEPLMYSVYLGSSAILGEFMQPDVVDAYFLIDLVSAVLFVAGTFYLMRTIKRPATERFLLGALLLFSGGCQFYFGYVENYALQYVFTTALAALGWLILQMPEPKTLRSAFGRLVLPTILFVLISGMNLGSLIFAPALLLLYGQVIFPFFRRTTVSKSSLTLGLAIAASATAGGMLLILLVIGFNPMNFVHHILAKDNNDFLPLFHVDPSYFAYTMFSPVHLLDWMNSLLHVAPFGLFVPFAIVPFFMKEIRWKEPALIYLLAMTVCGLAFTWIINSSAGLARDWDLFASFYTPLMVLGVYLYQLPLKFDGRRQFALVCAGLTMLFLVFRIGVNASPEKHLARMEMLESPVLMALSTQMFYHENIANYYYDAHNYEGARMHYERYIAINWFNPRILANLADTYRKLNEKDKYFEMLKKTVAQGTNNPGVYSNLGVEYVSRGDTADGIAMNLKCLQLNANQPQAYANLAFFYFNTNKPADAARCAVQALNLGEQDPAVFRVAAKAFTETGEYARALRYYDQYLAMVPQDETIKNLREKVAARARMEP